MVALGAALSAVQAEQKRINVTKALLTLLIVLPVAVGWSARMAWRGAVWALSFVAASVKVGWQAAAPASRGG